MTTLGRAKEEVITQPSREALQNQVIGHTIAVPTFPTNALPGNKSPGPRWAPGPGPACYSSLLLWIMKAAACVRVAAIPLLQSQNGPCFLGFEEGHRRSRKQMLAKATSRLSCSDSRTRMEDLCFDGMSSGSRSAPELLSGCQARLNFPTPKNHPIHPSLHGHFPVFWEKWMDPMQCLLYPFCIPLPNIEINLTILSFLRGHWRPST